MGYSKLVIFKFSNTTLVAEFFGTLPSIKFNLSAVVKADP